MSRRNSYTSKAALAAGYRSGFEKDVADELTRRGITFEYESKNCQFHYYKRITNGECDSCDSKVVVQRKVYTCDFYLPDSKIYIETKGRFTAEDRAKHILISQRYPDIDLRMLFQSDGKATPTKRYSEWCDWKCITYGFIVKKTKAREGKYIPEKWLEELQC